MASHKNKSVTVLQWKSMVTKWKARRKRSFKFCAKEFVVIVILN